MFLLMDPMCHFLQCGATKDWNLQQQQQMYVADSVKVLWSNLEFCSVDLKYSWADFCFHQFVLHSEK